MLGAKRPQKLRVLPFHLVLASLPKDQLPACTHALLKLLLYPESKERFFSITDTSDELSLVLEESFLSMFPEQTLQYTNQRWRAFKFDEGPLGFESTGIVSSVATPLAQAKICLFYVSTFTTGYTLVEEQTLESATECLKSAGFTFSNERDIDSHLRLAPPNRIPPHIFSMSPNLSSTQLVVSKLPYQLYLATLGKKDVGPLAEKWIKLVFYPERSHRFFSFTETPDEISVILDVASVQSFPPGSLTVCDRKWNALQICEGSFGSHGSDTINKFSKPLADACVSIFNVSTYSNDYTLIEEHNMDKSLMELRKKLNIILDEEELDEPDL